MSTERDQAVDAALEWQAQFELRPVSDDPDDLQWVRHDEVARAGNS
jgi:hypothetical protein